MTFARHPVPSGDLRKRLHDEQLVIARDVGVLEERGDFILSWRNFVVTRRDGHTQARQLTFDLGHVRTHAFRDSAEIMVRELLILG